MEAFLFLVGGTLVSMFLQLFVLMFLVIMVWDIEGTFLTTVFRPIFIGAVTGVFVSAAFPPAQPFVAALITSVLMLASFRFAPHRRLVLVLVNVIFAFGPPFIRATSGL